MNDLVLEKTKELGQTLAECAEHLEVIRWTEAMENDQAAKDLVEEYNRNRSAKLQEMRGKEMDAEEMKAARDYIQNEFNRILENDTILHYIEANKRFEELMKQVNNILKFCVTGEEEADGCGGSCSTCGGCH